MKQRYLFRFETEKQIENAVAKLEAAGIAEFETYSPYPLEFVFDAKARLSGETHPLDAGKTAHRLQPQKLAIAAATGGVIGGAMGYYLQYFTEVTEFPRMIADRPQHSWPAFMLVTFEMTILGAALSIFYAFFYLTKLPRLNHPAFSVPNFERASQDQFFIELVFDDNDPLIERWTSHFNSVEVHHVAID